MARRNEPLTVRPVAFALGAEVSGCDLRKTLDKAAQQKLRRALVEFQVLVFRDQKLKPEQLLRFAEYFGPLAPMRDENEILDGQPNIIRLSNASDSKTRGYGKIWHSDGLDFLPVPDGATFLNCMACPPHGGDTEFANLYLAYDALSASYRTLLKGLCWHVPDLPKLAHPAVRTHLETGRPHLYLPGKNTRFCGMTAQESQPILDFLMRHRTKDRFIYRHRWRVHDLVVWENCATNHKVVNDLDGSQPRLMNRTRTKGALLPLQVDPRSGRVLPTTSGTSR